VTRRSLLVALLVLLASSPARALDPARRFTVDVWSARNGLPGWIRAIAQTPDGYLWIGTNLGLYRYGGAEVTPLRPPRALDRAGDVMGLLAARDGTLWITPGRGDPVCLRGQAMGECLPEGQRLPPGTRIADVEEDAEGAIWLAAPAGVYRFAAGRLTLARAIARPTAVHRDARGRLWVGTADGLYVEEAGALERRGEPGAVSAIIGRGDRLWVATEAGPARDGVALVPGADRARALTDDRDGNLWMAGAQGLGRYRVGGKVERFGRSDGLPDDNVTALFEDREGSLWVGTRGGGLAQLTDRTLDGESGPPSLRDRWVSTVAEDAAGALWVGSRLGLTRWRDGQEQTFPLPGGVLTLALAPDLSVWVGTERGLWRVHDDRVDLVADAPVSALYLDQALWIGTATGLGRLEGDKVVPLPAEAGLQQGSIRSIQRDDQGTLWFSAAGTLLQVSSGRVQRPPAGSGLGRVRAMTRDEDGALWLATYDGLVKRQRGAWVFFGEDQGLERGDLYEVIADDLGSLWLGASHGILKISRASLADVQQGKRHNLDVASFDETDQHREVGATAPHQPSAWRARDGRLWFASSRGVVSAVPRRLSAGSAPPLVRVEQALVDGRPVVPEATTFPPGTGALEFHFAAITLIAPHQVRHRYRLEGFESAWVDAGPRRAAYYTNIPPGHYRFHVQASNADGVWNTTGAAVALTLSPHFYQTWWCYVLALALAGVVVLSGHRLHLAQVHGRYAAIFAERTRMARELHDSLLQGMSGAVMLLRALRKRPSSAASEIEEVERILVSNVEETRRLVWGLRGAELTLVEAVTGMVRRAPRPVQLAITGDEPPVPVSLRHELSRIGEEALNNALRHAQAHRIDVRLTFEPGKVTLSVCDDGCGFDPAAVPLGRLGLTGMRERAAALGVFTLKSHPGGGTKVEVVVAHA
jgi:ligand-binding sensor domain-containing protein